MPRRWPQRRGPGAARAEGAEAAKNGPLVAGLAAGLGAGLFVAARVATTGPSLAQLAATAVPYAEARGNGRPTVVEFYADWCEVCNEMAPEAGALRREYGDRLNFVMLNIDNPKWAEELQAFDIDGIPHFEFLDAAGQSRGSIIGKLPAEVLEADAAALADPARRAPLPYLRKGRVKADMVATPIGPRPAEAEAGAGPGAEGLPPSVDALPRDHS